MSKPSPGSVAHPSMKPRHNPVSSQIRRPPPPPPRVNQSRALPRTNQGLPNAGLESQESLKAAEAANTKTLWETIIRRKKLISAIAIGVVVVAGSILGARIKESRQEYGKRQELEEAAKRLAESSAMTAPAAIKALATTATAGSKTHDVAITGDKSSDPTGVTQAVARQNSGFTVDIARQITLLEDRKAILNRERFNLEQKIQRLRERQVRKQAMEARRPQPIRVDK